MLVSRQYFEPDVRDATLRPDSALIRASNNGSVAEPTTTAPQAIRETTMINDYLGIPLLRMAGCKWQ
jgi:hypothetical protein